MRLKHFSASKAHLVVMFFWKKEGKHLAPSSAVHITTHIVAGCNPAEVLCVLAKGVLSILFNQLPLGFQFRHNLFIIKAA